MTHARVDTRGRLGGDLHDPSAGPSTRARLLRVRVPLTTITPSRAQREPAPVERSARCRAPSTGTIKRPIDPRRGALRVTHWLAVSQARIRASYFPQNATLAVNDRDGDPGADDRCRRESPAACEQRSRSRPVARTNRP